MVVCIGERCGALSVPEFLAGLFMQHVSTLIMLLISMVVMLVVTTFVQDVPYPCCYARTRVQRIGTRDFEPFILGWAHFSGWAGKPGCPRIFGGAALDFLSAVGAFFMQHVSTLILLVLPWTLRAGGPDVRAGRPVCVLSARAQLAAHRHYWISSLFILGRAHFSGLAGKPGCPRIFGGAALDLLSAFGTTCGGVTTTSCRRYRCFVQAVLDGQDVLADPDRIGTF